MHNKSCNKSWVRLIKKINEIDSLICPKCGGDMCIIAFIEDYKAIKKILDWLGIDEFKRGRLSPKAFAVKIYLTTILKMIIYTVIIQIFRKGSYNFQYKTFI